MKEPLLLASILLSSACSSTTTTTTTTANAHPLAASTVVDRLSSVKIADFSDQDIVREVLLRNPSIAQAAAVISQAKSQLSLSKSAFLPQLNLHYSYMQADAPSAYLFKTIDSRKFSPGTDFNNPGSFDNYETSLELGINLYAGGAHALSERMAEQQVDAARLQQQLVKQELTAATLQTILNIEQAQQMLEVSNAAIRLIAAQLLDTGKHISAGVALRSDLLSLQARQSAARDTQLQAVHALELSKAALATLLNISPSDLPQLDDSSYQLHQQYCGQIPTTDDEALGQAQSQHPQLQAANLALKTAKLNLERTAAGSAPSVNLFGQTWVDSPKIGYDDAELNYSVGLMIDFNLTDGGALAARESAARAQLANAAAAARILQSKIASEARAAFLNLSSAQSRLEVARAGTAQAAEGLRLVKVQYDNQVATITRFLEAEQMNTQAEMRMIQAQNNVRSAQIELTLATGNFKNF